MFAAGNGREDIVRELLKAGADASIADSKGNTARSEALAFASVDADVSKKIVALIDEHAKSSGGSAEPVEAKSDAAGASDDKKTEKKKKFGFF